MYALEDNITHRLIEKANKKSVSIVYLHICLLIWDKTYIRNF